MVNTNVRGNRDDVTRAVDAHGRVVVQGPKPPGWGEDAPDAPLLRGAPQDLTEAQRASLAQRGIGPTPRESVGVVSTAPATGRRRIRPADAPMEEGWRRVSPEERAARTAKKAPAPKPPVLKDGDVPRMGRPIVTTGPKKFKAQSKESRAQVSTRVLVPLRGFKPVARVLTGEEAAAAAARDRAPLPSERRTAAKLARQVGPEAVASNKKAIKKATSKPSGPTAKVVGATPEEQGITGPTSPQPILQREEVPSTPMPVSTTPPPKNQRVPRKPRKKKASAVVGPAEPAGVPGVPAPTPSGTRVEYFYGDQFKHVPDPSRSEEENEADREAARADWERQRTQHIESLVAQIHEPTPVLSQQSIDSHRRALDFYSTHGAGAEIDLNEQDNIGEGGGAINTPLSQRGIGWGADAARRALASHISKRFTLSPGWLDHRPSSASEHNPRVVALGHTLFSGFGPNPAAAEEFSSRVNTIARARRVAPDSLTPAEYEGVTYSLRSLGHIPTADIDAVRRSGGLDLSTPGRMVLRGREGVPEEINTRKLMRPNALSGRSASGTEQTAAQQQRAALTEMDTADFLQDDTPIEKTHDEYTDLASRSTPDLTDVENPTDLAKEVEDRTAAKIAAEMRNHPAAKAGRALVKAHREGAITDEQLEARLAPLKTQLVGLIPSSEAAKSEKHFTEAFTPEGIASKASTTVELAQERYAMGVVEREMAAERNAEATAHMTHHVSAVTTDDDGRVTANVERLKDKSGKLRISRKLFTKHVDIGHTVNIDGHEHTVTKVNKFNVHVLPVGSGPYEGATAAQRRDRADTTRIGWEALAAPHISGYVAAQNASERAQEQRSARRTDARAVTQEMLRERNRRGVAPSTATPAPEFTDEEIEAAAAAKKEEAKAAIGQRGVSRPAATNAQGTRAFGGRGTVANPRTAGGRSGNFNHGSSK